MLGFQAAPRLFSGQADEQFCLCSSEYEMSTCVIYCTNSHLFKGGRDMCADSTSLGFEKSPCGRVQGNKLQYTSLILSLSVYLPSPPERAYQIHPP